MRISLDLTTAEAMRPDDPAKKLTKRFGASSRRQAGSRSDAKEELKTADIARNARAFTFLISCKAKAKEKETAKN
jgi:hypothetical protein